MLWGPVTTALEACTAGTPGALTSDPKTIWSRTTFPLPSFRFPPGYPPAPSPGGWGAAAGAGEVARWGGGGQHLGPLGAPPQLPVHPRWSCQRLGAQGACEVWPGSARPYLPLAAASEPPAPRQPRGPFPLLRSTFSPSRAGDPGVSEHGGTLLPRELGGATPRARDGKGGTVYRPLTPLGASPV